MGDGEHAKKGSRSCSKQAKPKNYNNISCISPYWDRESDENETLNFTTLIYSDDEWATASAHHTAEPDPCFTPTLHIPASTTVKLNKWHEQSETVYDNLLSDVVVVNLTWLTSGRRSHPLVIPLLVSHTHTYILWSLTHTHSYCDHRSGHRQCVSSEVR